MKKWSALIIIGEIQINTTVRDNLIPVKIACIKNSNNLCWLRCGTIGILIHCSWECFLNQLLQKTLWSIFSKPETVIWPRNSTFVYLPPTFKNSHSKVCIPTIIINCWLTIAKIWTQYRFPMPDEWVIEMWRYRQWNTIQLQRIIKSHNSCNLIGTGRYYIEQSKLVKKTNIGWSNLM